MKDLRVRLTERIARTKDVESFRWMASEKLLFAPGQFVQVVFDEAARGNKELNKYLSFSSSPARDYIEFTKRLSTSAFSNRLRALKPGDELLLKAPMGTCVFEERLKRIAFLIGGIGITPVISIIGYIMEKELDTDICLVYSNRTDEDIAFKHELDSWQGANPNLHISYLVTDCAPKDRTCTFGTINTELVKSRVCDLAARTFFIFGPPRMVGAMQQVCRELGCSGERVKTENFVGY